MKQMLDNDPYSQWLGVKVLNVAPGRVTLQMQVREEMLNGFRVGHGGVTYAFADSALAFACNSHGQVSLLLNANMAYPAPVQKSDILTAVAEEENRTRRTAIYSVRVSRNDDEVVGLFQATVYRTSKTHFDA